MQAVHQSGLRVALGQHPGGDGIVGDDRVTLRRQLARGSDDVRAGLGQPLGERAELVGEQGDVMPEAVQFVRDREAVGLGASGVGKRERADDRPHAVVVLDRPGTGSWSRRRRRPLTAR